VGALPAYYVLLALTPPVATVVTLSLLGYSFAGFSPYPLILGLLAFWSLAVSAVILALTGFKLELLLFKPVPLRELVFYTLLGVAAALLMHAVMRVVLAYTSIGWFWGWVYVTRWGPLDLALVVASTPILAFSSEILYRAYPLASLGSLKQVIPVTCAYTSLNFALAGPGAALYGLAWPIIPLAILARTGSIYTAAAFHTAYRLVVDTLIPLTL